MAADRQVPQYHMMAIDGAPPTRLAVALVANRSLPLSSSQNLTSRNLDGSTAIGEMGVGRCRKRSVRRARR